MDSSRQDGKSILKRIVRCGGTIMSRISGGLYIKPSNFGKLAQIVGLVFILSAVTISMAATASVYEDYESGGTGGWDCSPSNVNAGWYGDRSVQTSANCHNSIDADLSNYETTVVLRPLGSVLGMGVNSPDFNSNGVDVDFDYADNHFTLRLRDSSGNIVDTVTFGYFNPDEWHEVTLSGNGTHHTAKITHLSSGDTWSRSLDNQGITPSGQPVEYYSANSATVEIDQIESSTQTSSVSGQVTDSNGGAITNANITTNNSKSTTTDSNGQYNLSLSDGTYNITASKPGYENQTKTVTVSGSDKTVDFSLKELNRSIELNTRLFIKHGEDTPYSVIANVDGDRRDVTGNSTVTSGNTSIVTINSTDHLVVATNDTSVNGRTYVRAEWTDSDGKTYSTERNVTVANLTVNNMDVLPTFPRFSASISDETIMTIIIASGAGAAAALFATSFAGISAMTMIMLLGWLAGYVNNGMAIVTVLTAMFIGMNVAGNVDYTVRR